MPVQLVFVSKANRGKNPTAFIIFFFPNLESVHFKQILILVCDFSHFKNHTTSTGCKTDCH